MKQKRQDEIDQLTQKSQYEQKLSNNNIRQRNRRKSQFVMLIEKKKIKARNNRYSINLYL